jgi:hypothetical protein
MAINPAPPRSYSPKSMLLTPSYCCWRSAPRAAAGTSAVAAAAARRTLSSGWDLSRLSAVRPAARKARLEELDTSNMLLRQRIIFLGSPVSYLLYFFPKSLVLCKLQSRLDKIYTISRDICLNTRKWMYFEVNFIL